jgi:hypothetical protein
LRLEEYGFSDHIDEFWIPKLIDYNDELWVVEMEFITKSPYLLGFAKVRIDRPPDFSPEVLEYEEAKGRELFQHHWPDVKRLLASLESIGIYYLDPQLENIKFPDL